jgi:hypothetical protein
MIVGPKPDRRRASSPPFMAAAALSSSLVGALSLSLPPNLTRPIRDQRSRLERTISLFILLKRPYVFLY